MYYRVTYNGEGIYNALKKLVSSDIWNNMISSSDFNWLPKPQIILLIINHILLKVDLIYLMKKYYL